jgi:hypothetical protein
VLIWILEPKHIPPGHGGEQAVTIKGISFNLAYLNPGTEAADES